MKTKIGFFDSGIGGVTVLKKCIKLIDNFTYVYYSDSINNPYGDKSNDEIIKIVDNVVNELINRGCNVIVIACNTASSVCVKYLRDKYKDIKFVAIVPAIKLVYDECNGSNTLIMATKGTMYSEKFQELYKLYGGDNCYLMSCSGLANLIEDGNMELVDDYLVENISCYKNKISSIVLGCTHYPIIKNNIRKILGDVNFFDGSDGVAKQLVRVIKENGFESNDGFKIEFIDSLNSKGNEKRFFEILEGSSYE